jgi:hypothetical protein
MHDSQSKTFYGLSMHSSARILACALGLALAAASASASGPAQQSFPSAQAGADALAIAEKANDPEALAAIFGPDASRLLSSGDPEADAHNRETFSRNYAASNKLVLDGDAKATLVIGKDAWPLPIPLVRQGNRWHFDTLAGEDEILKRRIGRNELDAIHVCQTIVDAEREYASHHVDADGVPVYAARFASTPGKHDGLYWPTSESEAQSPLGPLLAKAADEGYPAEGTYDLEPYHGYYYRILTRQGKNAPDGPHDYVVKGKLIGGFAVIAYPARYDTSGIMSFSVDQDGVVYAKDLGERTKSAVAATTEFNPDVSWKREVPRTD